MAYNAGAAFVQIKPSLRGFHEQLRAELRGIQPTVTVRPVIDRSQLRQLQTLAAGQSIVVLARVVADVAQARAQMAAVRRDADQVGRARPTIQVAADTAAATLSLTRLLFTINQFAAREVNIRVDADTGAAVSSITRLVSLVTTLGGLAGVVGGLGGAVAGLGAAGVVAAAGIAPALLSFRGIGDAVTALSDQQKTAGVASRQAAQEQAQAAAQVESAQQRVARAARDAAQARTDGAREVSRAETGLNQARAEGAESVARAVADAEDRIASARDQAAEQYASAVKRSEQAQDTLRQATRDLQYAQQDMNRAWEDGRRSLQDLQDQLDSSNLDMEQATFDLADALERLQEARASGDTDAIARADLAYRRQVETIDQLSKRQERLAVDNAKAQAAGVAGSEQVVAAEQEVAQARERVGEAAISAREAEAGVEQARLDGAASVARAERDGAQQIADARQQAAQRTASAEQALSDARDQASRRVQAAEESVTDAQRALQQALAQTGTAGQAAADKVAQAFAELSPAAATFARFLTSDVLPALDRLSATSATGFLPGLQAGISALIGQLPRIDAAIGLLARNTGGAVQTLLTALASPGALGFFDTLARASTAIMPLLAQSTITLAGAFGQLILALLPLAPAAFAFLDQLSGLIVILAPAIAQLLGGLIPAASAFLTALQPLGPVLAALQPILLVLGQALSTVLGAVLTALAPILVALTPLIQELATQLAGSLVSAIVALTPLLVQVAQWLTANPGLVLNVIGAIAGLAGALGPLSLVFGLVLTALRGFVIVTTVSAALAALGLQGTQVGRAIMLLVNPINLLRIALPFIGQAFAFVGRALLATLGPVGWLAIALTTLYTSNEQFRDAINRLLGVIVELGGAILSSLMPAFTAAIDVFDVLLGAVTPVIDALAAVLVPVINTLSDTLTDLTPIIVPLAQVFLAIRVAMVLWAAAQWALNAAMLANPVTLLVIAIGALIAAAVLIIQNWDAVSKFFIELWGTVTSGVQTAVGAIGRFFADLPNNIFRGLGSLAGMLVRLAIDGWNGFTTGLATAFASTVAFVQSIPQRFMDGLASLGAFLMTAGTDGINGFTTGITTGFNDAAAFFTGLPSRILGFFTGAPGWLATTGTDIINGLVGGLVGAGRGVLDFFGGLIDSFLDGFRAGLGIASPSTVFFQFGIDILQGLLNGLTSLGQMVLGWITGFADMIADGFRAGISVLLGLWTGFWNGLTAVATGVFDAIQDAISAGWRFIANLFGLNTGIVGAIWERFWNILSAVAGAIFAGVRAMIDLVWAAIRLAFDSAVGFLTGLWDRFWTGLRTVADFVFGAIRAAVDFYWGLIRRAFDVAVAAVQFLWDSFWEGLRIVATAVWTGISNFLTAGFNTFSAFFSAVWTGIRDFFTTTWNILRDTAVTVWTSVRDFFGGAFANFSRFFSDTWNGIVRSFSDIFNGIVGIAENVWRFVRDKFVAGINFVIDIINTFAEAINTVARALGFTLDLHVNRLSVGGEVDAIRRSLGGTVEMRQVIHRADGGTVSGRLPGYAPGHDTIPARAGNQPYLLAGGEYIVRPEATRAMGPEAMHAINNAHRRPVGLRAERDTGPIRLAAGGYLYPEMGRIVQGGVPGTRVTSTLRPGDSGYHGRGKAVDLAGPRSMDMPFMLRINRWLAQNWGKDSAQLIHTQPGAINLLNGRPHSYGAGTRADHRDHVHWAVDDLNRGGIGGFFQQVGAVAGVGWEYITTAMQDLAANLLNPVRNAINGVGDRFGFPGKFAAGAMNKVLDSLFGTAKARDDAANAGMADSSPAATGDQIGNARIIGQVARSMGFGRNGMVVALATALQESGLRNINYGDRDSVGLFQQRPSQGWGSVGQIMNPSYSARKFFEALRRVRGWEGMPVTVAAQRVQRSAFPDAYAKHVGRANSLASQVGFDRGGLARGRGFMLKDVIAPERTLDPRQTVAFEQLVSGLTGRGVTPSQVVSDAQWRERGRGAGDSPLIGSLTVPAPEGGSARQVVDEVMAQARHARLAGRYHR